MLIKDIFTHPIERRITQVIKVDDVDNEAEVAQELSEYVITDELEKRFLEFLEVYTSMRKGQGGQRDKIGVWVSGFFGSGKSHFAKILGHLLCNRKVTIKGEQRDAADIFLERIAENSSRKLELRGQITQLRNFFQSQTLMFMIKSLENQLNPNVDSIALIMYREYLRSLGFSSDLWIGRLELLLSKRGKYEIFCEKFKQITGDDWVGETREQFPIYRSQIAKVLRASLPELYATDDEADRVLEDIKSTTQLTPQNIVKELASYAKDQDAKAGEKSFKLVFIIDEIGLFIGTNDQKLLELQAIAHDFATYGEGRLWLIVTAQEAMDKVIEGVKQKQADYSRIMDRFGIQLRMTSEQIERVLEERILKKRPTAQPTLESLFRKYEGKIASLAVPDSNRKMPMPNFVQFERIYPFLPYYFPAMQDAFAKLRSKGGKSVQLSGAERSMIGVVQGVLNLANNHYDAAQIGRIVTLDEIYEQIANEISGDDRRTINSVAETVPDQGFAPIKVIKALYVISQIEWLNCSLDNIARVLLPNIDSDFNAHRQKVAVALKDLKDAHYIIEIDNQYRYLSATERSIEDEISSEHIRTNDLRRAAREFLRKYSVNDLGRINYENGLTTFDIQIYADDEPVKTSGELILKVYSPVAQAFDDELRISEVRDVKSPGDERTVYWIPADITDPKADLERLLRLETVVNKRVSTGDGSTEERAIIRDKQVEADKLRTKISSMFNRALFTGAIIFNGDYFPLNGQNSHLNSILNREIVGVIRHVYTRFSPAAYKVNEKSIGEMLTTKSPNLPNVEPDLKLWNKQSQLNIDAEVVQPILDYLKQPGANTDGKAILDYFERIPYGWSPTVVRVVLAALFRAGTIGVKSGGKYYNDSGVPAAQETLTKLTVFRNADFDYDPTGLLTIAQRQEARLALNTFFDRQVDDTTNMLAQTVKTELQKLKTDNELLTSRVQNLPVPDLLFRVRPTLDSVLNHPKSDNLVKAFLEQRPAINSILKLHEQLNKFLGAGRLADFQRILQLRQVIEKALPYVSELNTAEVRQSLEDWQVLSDNRTVVEKWSDAQLIYRRLLDAYRQSYAELFARRTARYQEVSQQVNQFGDVPETITRYVIEQSDAWDDQTLNFAGVNTSVQELYNDLELAPIRQLEAITKLQKKIADDLVIYTTPVLVQVSHYLNGDVTDEAALQAKIAALTEKVRQELAHGRKVILG